MKMKWENFTWLIMFLLSLDSHCLYAPFFFPSHSKESLWTPLSHLSPFQNFMDDKEAVLPLESQLRSMISRQVPLRAWIPSVLG